MKKRQQEKKRNTEAQKKARNRELNELKTKKQEEKSKKRD